MSDDVEMNEVKNPLLDNDSSRENTDSKVPDVKFELRKSGKEFTGLTKEELEKFANDPFWKKLRIILFIIFWLVWVAMLIGAILIVVLSPKCPKRPKLDFWEKKTGYWVDTLGYADSDNNNVGDLEGLINKLDYIQKEVGAGYIILDQIFAGQYNNKKGVIGAVNSFREIDSYIGNQESFKKLIKETRKRGLEIVLTADFNSLSRSSNFVKTQTNVLMKWDTQMTYWTARDGITSERAYESNQIYSSSPQQTDMMDLDLTNEIVLNEIKESVKLWLDLGVRGFLLTNVAFYVENVTMPVRNLEKKVNVTSWYSNQSLNGQIFSRNTINFLQEIKNVMNEVAKKTDRSRLLILEAGNVGFGLMGTEVRDEMLQYLDGPEKVADMIIGREFLSHRGWNIEMSDFSKSSVNNYLKMIPENLRSRVALTSATSTSLRTTNLKKLAAPFLMPSNSIIYFGSEIGIDCAQWNDPMSLTFYPKSHKFPLDGVLGEFPTKCNHMIMPWDNSGKGFSCGNRTISNDYIVNSPITVQGLTAIGRGETILQLHKKLIKVREEPSLLWGNITMFLNEMDSDASYEIFIREANGFEKIIIALITGSIDGKVFSFSSICGKVTPILVYPSNPNLPENKEVDAINIYLKIHKKESLHVFKCVA